MHKEKAYRLDLGCSQGNSLVCHHTCFFSNKFESYLCSYITQLIEDRLDGFVRKLFKLCSLAQSQVAVYLSLLIKVSVKFNEILAKVGSEVFIEYLSLSPV